MKKTTTITYNTEIRDGVSTSELEYKDYVKNEKGEENLLHYKVRNCVGTDTMKVISDSRSGGESLATNESFTNESFNKIYKVDDVIDETIGVSSNNKDWKIHEYKNHQLNKEYEREYDTIKFDIKSDLLETGTCKDGTCKAGRTGKSVARSYIENE
jgi:hypothetical protein